MMSRFTLTLLMVAATGLTTACNPSQPPPPEPDAVTPETVQPIEDAAPTTDSGADPADAAAPATASGAETPAESPVASVTRTGAFASAEHETTGGAELISQGGQTTLVFDDNFATSNGPDLVVVLHRSANLIAETTPPAYPLNEDDYVVIAPLTTVSGRQEYVIPAEIDLAAFEAVAVWCQQFNATFGAAPLQ